MDAPVHDRPAISPIAEGLGPHGSALYIGGSEGARDLGLLRRHGITTVVNCAINLDINYVETPSDAPDVERLAAGFAGIRYYKLGMIDGEGSPETMMLGAYYILDGALRQSMPKRPTYPFRDGGNLLVNCRGGRSRSVALVSLFLHKQQPELYPTLDDAVAAIRERRQLMQDEWFETPKPMLYEAARKASAWIDLIERARHGDPQC
ncbi:protein phosphatase [Sinorhizobium medicae]|uniref:Protein phosphatase n=1 Tax=Sinorhizobium medicae TaxID=110321 RepID=A0A508X1N9_9HYPH|nr:dual specificity protein phosphatase [Sinorhizobium medicae]MDX0451864.1 protein phosphatase [Sinorhizobium medicae]MDX0519998.1 protein phosphatase [Sinorhizobium medicae]MDX0547422.1 protein phosphatase [Sinorhizobium medicae]MDX0631542.1 protein phosphatase [Sinorhizobium medicae]MDX0692990.1 protein phosphatase [Sinorhizobium medicae]